MKKILMLVLCVLTFVFSACEPAWHALDYDYPLEGGMELQLIYYDNPEVKKMGGSKKRVIPFDFEKMEIIEVLPEKKAEEMLTYLQQYGSTLLFSLEEGNVDSPNGYAFRMIYPNGNFLVISFAPYHYAGMFNLEGRLIKYYGAVVFFSETECNLFFTTQLSKNNH